MTKIRKFRIELRWRELARRAKRLKIDLAAAGLADEAALVNFCAGYQKGLEPAVIFESFNAEHERASLAPVPGLAFSLGAATIGRAPEALEAHAAQDGQTERLRLLELCRTLALEDAVAFVLGLVKQEADEEACELSPLNPLTEQAAVEAALGELQGAKIGLSFEQAGLSPVASTVFSLSWIARPRRKAARR